MRANFVRFLSLLVFVTLAACAPSTTATTEPSPTSLPAAPSPTATTEVPAPGITITDALGRELSFAQPPQRLVIAGRASSLIVNTVYTFPEAQEIVAGVEERKQSAVSPLPLIEPNLADKVLLEANAGAEQIAPLHPDAVLLKTYMAETVGQPLEQLGIPVVYLDLETPESFFRDVVMLGDLFADPERAQEVVHFYQERMSQVDAMVGAIPQEDRPRILVMQYSDKGGEIAFLVPPASWLQTRMAELAGGEAVWTEASESGGWAVVGFEQIAAWDPDQIYIVYYPADARPITQQLAADSAWQALRAVQSGQLYAFAGDFLSWDQPDARWILGLQWLATKVQPALTSTIDILAEVNQFYAALYRLDTEAIESQVLPNLRGDLP